MNAQDLLSKVLNADKDIRYATICDMEGKELGTTVREGVVPLLNEAEHKEALQYAVSAWKTRNKFVSKLGHASYALAVYDNVCRLTMTLGDRYMLLITFGPKVGMFGLFSHLQKMFHDTS
jgi:hypothetical protein